MRPSTSIACALACALFAACGDREPDPTPAPTVEPAPPAAPIVTPAAPVAPAAEPPPPIALAPATVETAGGPCEASDPIPLGAADASATVRVATGASGALVAWATPGSAPGVTVRALDADGAPRGEAVAVELDADEVVGLVPVGARFVVVGHAAAGLALRALDDDGAPAGDALDEPLPRGITPLTHGGRWPEDPASRNIDVRVAGDVIGVAYAIDASGGGAVRMHRFRVREDGGLERLEPFEIGTAGGTLRGWLSAGGGELALLAGADEGEGPIRWLATADGEPSRVRGFGGAVRDFTVDDGGVAFVYAEGRDRFFVARTDRGGALQGEATAIEAGEKLPAPWGTRLITRVRAEGSSVALLRRDAALRAIGQPAPLGSVARGGDGSSAWTGRAFVVAWPAPVEGGAQITARTVRCGAS